MKELEFKLQIGETAMITQGGRKLTRKYLYGGVKTVVEKVGQALEGQLLGRTRIVSVGRGAEGTPMACLVEKGAEQPPGSIEKEGEPHQVPRTRRTRWNPSAWEAAATNPAATKLSSSIAKTASAAHADAIGHQFREERIAKDWEKTG
jgi:hypothetical protein